MTAQADPARLARRHQRLRVGTLNDLLARAQPLADPSAERSVWEVTPGGFVLGVGTTLLVLMLYVLGAAMLADRRRQNALRDVNAERPDPTEIADRAWSRTLAALDESWDRDWPATIRTLERYIQVYASPPSAPGAAEEKLVVAYGSYGDALCDDGQTREALQQYYRGLAVRPEAEALRERVALCQLRGKL